MTKDEVFYVEDIKRVPDNWFAVDQSTNVPEDDFEEIWHMIAQLDMEVSDFDNTGVMSVLEQQPGRQGYNASSRILGHLQCCSRAPDGPLQDVKTTMRVNIPRHLNLDWMFKKDKVRYTNLFIVRGWDFELFKSWMPAELRLNNESYYWSGVDEVRLACECLLAKIDNPIFKTYPTENQKRDELLACVDELGEKNRKLKEELRKLQSA